MEFPFYLHVGPLTVHPHWVFESLAYLVGARLYTWLRPSADTLSTEARGWIVVAAFIGAVVGGKVVYWASDPALLRQQLLDPAYLLGGKSVIGGLVGGLIAVEWTKRRIGITRATGDVFALPLVIGIAIGRVGCFLTGLEDHTHGLPASLPWAVDFGDGIARHPTQLYEIAFLLVVLLPGLLWLRQRPERREGDLFKLFMVGYFGFRLWLETIKPGVFVLGLNAIQWVCTAVLLLYVVQMRERLQPAMRTKQAAHA